MTDSNNLIERVSTAISTAHVHEGERPSEVLARAAILAVLEGISHPAMHKKIIDEHGAAPVVDFQKMIDHIKADLE